MTIGGTTSPFHHTWLTALLPYLDQAPLFNTINFNLPAYKQPFTQQQINILRCPSDSGLGEVPGGLTDGLAITNYVGCEGSDWWDRPNNGDDFGNQWFGGVFTTHYNCPISAITDGTSNTIAVGETTGGSFGGGGWQTNGQGKQRLPNSPVGGPIVRTAFIGNTFTAAVAACNGCPQHGWPTVCTQPDGGAVSDFWRPTPGNPLYQPVFMAVYGINGEWAGANSLHVGGAHFLMADGSVQFINQSVNWLTVFDRLCGAHEGLIPGSY